MHQTPPSGKYILAVQISEGNVQNTHELLKPAAKSESASRAHPARSKSTGMTGASPLALLGCLVGP